MMAEAMPGFEGKSAARHGTDADHRAFLQLRSAVA
jgi:hypothetical protein